MSRNLIKKELSKSDLFEVLEFKKHLSFSCTNPVFKILVFPKLLNNYNHIYLEIEYENPDEFLNRWSRFKKLKAFL